MGLTDDEIVNVSCYYCLTIIPIGVHKEKNSAARKLVSSYFATIKFLLTSRDDERSKLIPRPQHSWRQCRLTLLWSESVLPMMLRFVPIHGGVFQFLLFSSSQLQN